MRQEESPQDEGRGGTVTEREERSRGQEPGVEGWGSMSGAD